MPSNHGLTAQRLRQLMSYDPETGVFTRIVPCGSQKVGPVRGIKNDSGYMRVSVDNHHHAMHRLAWLYMTGEWPTGQIDHINGIRDDNRFENLRDCPPSQNNMNFVLTKRNRSGFKGAHWDKRRAKWRAKIQAEERIVHLGYFETPQEAAHAYNKAAIQLHGEFAVLNPVGGVFIASQAAEGERNHG